MYFYTFTCRIVQESKYGQSFTQVLPYWKFAYLEWSSIVNFVCKESELLPVSLWWELPLRGLDLYFFLYFSCTDGFQHTDHFRLANFLLAYFLDKTLGSNLGLAKRYYHHLTYPDLTSLIYLPISEYPLLCSTSSSLF